MRGRCVTRPEALVSGLDAVELVVADLGLWYRTSTPSSRRHRRGRPDRQHRRASRRGRRRALRRGNGPFVDSAGRAGRATKGRAPVDNRSPTSTPTCRSPPSVGDWRVESGPRFPGRSSCASRRSWRPGWRSSARPCRCEGSRNATIGRASPFLRRLPSGDRVDGREAWPSCSCRVRPAIGRRSSPWDRRGRGLHGGGLATPMAGRRDGRGGLGRRC